VLAHVAGADLGKRVMYHCEFCVVCIRWFGLVVCEIRGCDRSVVRGQTPEVLIAEQVKSFESLCAIQASEWMCESEGQVDLLRVRVRSLGELIEFKGGLLRASP
jgi:hypothetical protein